MKYFYDSVRKKKFNYFFENIYIVLKWVFFVISFDSTTPPNNLQKQCSVFPWTIPSVSYNCGLVVILNIVIWVWIDMSVCVVTISNLTPLSDVNCLAGDNVPELSYVLIIMCQIPCLPNPTICHYNNQLLVIKTAFFFQTISVYW